MLSETRVLNSLEEICITQVATVNSFARETPPSACIYKMYIQAVDLCILYLYTHIEAKKKKKNLKPNSLADIFILNYLLFSLIGQIKNKKSYKKKKNFFPDIYMCVCVCV